MATPLLSKNQELSTSSESSTTSSSSSSPTSDESEEEGGVSDSEERKCDHIRSGSDEKTACMAHQTGSMTAEQFIPILNDEVKDLRKIDSEERKCDHLCSGSDEKTACMTHQTGNMTAEQFISNLNDEVKDLRKNIKELVEELSKKDKEVTDKDRLIHTLKNIHTLEKGKFESSLKTNKERVRELEEKLNEKDRDITEKNMAINTIENQSKMIQKLQKELNEKDGNIKEKNNANATLENHLKMVQELEEKLDKKDIEITEKNEEIATLEKKCEIKKEEVMKIHTQYDEVIKQNKRDLKEKASEIKRLQKYEENHAALQATLDVLQKKLGNYEATLAKANGKINQLTNELRTAGKEKEELLHRLSKIAGAKLTYNNPNIADLSDQKRPTKLAEEFAELYDNEWTDAFEDVDIERDEDKVAYMLSLLKAAYELCKLASQNHMEKMKSSICKLTVDSKHTSGERHKHPRNKCGEVVFDYQKFQDEQKKAVMELGKFVEIKLSTEFEKIVVDNIASEYCIDKNGRKKLYGYTQKCVNICWSMCRLEIPVAIGLQEVNDRMPLDTSVFKPYTKSGKFVDYIVWPPLYLHENGPLLCKGVAQGKD